MIIVVMCLIEIRPLLFSKFILKNLVYGINLALVDDK